MPFCPLPNNGTMKCAHLCTNQRAPVADHAPCLWSAEVWLVHRRVWMALWINKETKQRNKTNNIGSAHQIDGKIKVNKRLRWTMERVRSTLEDRALPICFVQDKRTVSCLFINRLCFKSSVMCWIIMFLCTVVFVSVSQLMSYCLTYMYSVQWRIQVGVQLARPPRAKF